MAQLIAVSGTQGSGKSTLIKALAEGKTITLINGHFVYFDDYKVSRSVQNQLGWSLVDAINDIDRVIQFQELIYDHKVRHDISFSIIDEDIDFVFVERSFIDIAVYTTLWFEQQMQRASHSQWQWFENYLDKCAEAQKMYDGLIIIPKHPDIPIEHDPQRASSDLNAKFEEVFISKYLHFCEVNKRLQPFVNIEDLDLPFRISKTTHFLDILHKRI